MAFALGWFVAVNVAWVVIAYLMVLRAKRRHARRGLSVRMRLHRPFFYLIFGFECFLLAACLHHAASATEVLFAAGVALTVAGFYVARRGAGRRIASLVLKQ